MLNTLVNNTQECTSRVYDPCIKYITFQQQFRFESNMPILQCNSADKAMIQGSVEMVCRRYTKMRDFCSYKNSNVNEITVYRDSISGQIVCYLTPRKDTSKNLPLKTFTMHYEMRHHAIANKIRCIAMPKIAWGLDSRLNGLERSF